MPRATSGRVSHNRHKKVLSYTKGHRASKHHLFRSANESMLHALDYAYEHRRERKADFRRLWITRISAGAKENGMNYSTFTHGLKLAGIDMNRKVLSEMAIHDKAAFALLTEKAKAAL